MEDIKKEDEILEGEKIEDTQDRIESEDNDKVEADELTLLQEENGKLKVELDEWKNSYARKNAEFQNFSKRKDKEVQDLRAFASEKVVERLFGVLDNLERGIEAATATKDFDSLVKGVEMTLSQMKTIMEAEGENQGCFYIKVLNEIRKKDSIYVWFETQKEDGTLVINRIPHYYLSGLDKDTIYLNKNVNTGVFLNVYVTYEY
jgi:hypothetical protein